MVEMYGITLIWIFERILFYIGVQILPRFKIQLFLGFKIGGIKRKKNKYYIYICLQKFLGVWEIIVYCQSRYLFLNINDIIYGYRLCR